MLLRVLGGKAMLILEYSLITKNDFTINPLTPELNPSAQRCLTRFFTVDFSS
jgi:hypothetical protein